MRSNKWMIGLLTVVLVLVSAPSVFAQTELTTKFQTYAADLQRLATTEVVSAIAEHETILLTVRVVTTDGHEKTWEHYLGADELAQFQGKAEAGNSTTVIVHAYAQALKLLDAELAAKAPSEPVDSPPKISVADLQNILQSVSGQAQALQEKIDHGTDEEKSKAQADLETLKKTLP